MQHLVSRFEIPIEGVPLGSDRVSIHSGGLDILFCITSKVKAYFSPAPHDHFTAVPDGGVKLSGTGGVYETRQAEKKLTSLPVPRYKSGP